MGIYGAALRELEQYRRDEAAGLLLRLPVPPGRYGMAGTGQSGLSLRGPGGREVPLWQSSHPAPHCRAYPLYPGPAGCLGEDCILHRGRGEDDVRA